MLWGRHLLAWGIVLLLVVSAGPGAIVLCTLVYAAVWSVGTIRRRRMTREPPRIAPVPRTPPDAPMPPGAFEEAVCAVLRTLGYTSVTRTRASGDEGVDILCADELGARVIVQCKRWKGNVGSVDVQKLAGAKATLQAHRALMVTTGGYTAPAIDLGARAGVECWDGQTLAGMARRGAQMARTSSAGRWTTAAI